MAISSQPELELVLTPAAGTEVKKFMTAEGVTAEEGGLRVSVMPRRLQRLQVQSRH